jgi:inositol-pentakisphosphate 2-kinase
MSSMLVDDSQIADHRDGLREVFTSALLPLLKGTPVLRIISKLQRTLDALDIEGLSNLWRIAHSSMSPYHVHPASPLPTDPADVTLLPPIGAHSDLLLAEEPTILDWTGFLDRYLSLTDAQLNNPPPPENLRYCLLAYLLSATFKDCSIIIRLDPLQPTLCTPKIIQGDRVTVIDLDPKSMDRLQKWERLDQNVVQAYSKVDDHKVCTDRW